MRGFNTTCKKQVPMYTMRLLRERSRVLVGEFTQHIYRQVVFYFQAVAVKAKSSVIRFIVRLSGTGL